MIIVYPKLVSIIQTTEIDIPRLCFARPRLGYLEPESTKRTATATSPNCCATGVLFVCSGGTGFPEALLQFRAQSLDLTCDRIETDSRGKFTIEEPKP